MAAALRRRLRQARALVYLPPGMATGGQEQAAASAERAAFLGLDYDRMDMAAAAAWLTARGADAPFGYVVTPNVDHVVRLEQADAAVHEAYAAADLCLCDSRILAALARRGGLDLPVVPGSDLTPLLLRRVVQPGDAVAVVGASEQTVAALRAAFPDLDIRHCPAPMGLRHDAPARDRVAADALATGARFTLLAFGSPQQELVAHHMKALGGTGTALCIGASVEFVTGAQRRAPRIVQRCGLEWGWRLASDPVRLWRRYLVDGPRIFRIAARWRRG